MAQLDAFKRQLISEIQTAYYNYAKTLSIDRLLEQTRELLEENLRVSEKLVENGKITEDAVYRAEAELAGLDQKKSEAEKNKTLAAAYFNFLLNRDLEDPILMDETPPLPPLEEIEIDKAVGRALKYRHEFQQLQHALSASSHQIALAKSGTLPSLFAVVDYGIQGETYSLDRDDDYWMASLILEWNVFNGNQNQAKKIQAILDQKKLEVRKKELEKQIRIQVHEAYLSYRTAGAAVKAAEKREESSEKSYAIVAKMYANGMAPQIALLDARNAFTSASINRIMAFYDLYLEKARFEQVTALFDLSFYQGGQGDDDEQ
jgi:outer membrane protein TolC